MIAQDMPSRPLRSMASGLRGIFASQSAQVGGESKDAHAAELQAQVKAAKTVCDQALDHIGQTIYGKTLQVRQSLACLLAQGHLLIEDVPGVGKTTLAQTLAHTLGLENNRV